MLLTEAVEALCLATDADGRSQRTVDSYRQKLRPLLKYLGDVQIESITVQHLRRYVKAMRDQEIKYRDHPTRPAVTRPLSRFTIASRVRALKRLFSWLVAEGVIEDNPATRIKAPAPKAQPKGIDWQDVADLLASTAGGSVTDLRDRALVWFLTDTGARAGGVVGLRREDLDLDRGVARVCEKGQKRRPVFFGHDTEEALRDWLALRPQDSRALVFVSLGRLGGQLASAELTHILRRRAAKAGVTGPVNSHRFRHGFARGYLERGGDLASLSAILGHASSAVTTQFYTVYATSELARMHAKHSPVAAVLEAISDGD